MQYLISNDSGYDCRVVLVSETPEEEKLIEDAQDNPQHYEDTFLFHYQKALEQKLNKDATFTGLSESSTFPSPVTVMYQITRGIGE